MESAVFVELPAFSRRLADYLDDEGYRGLQNTLLDNPETGDVIKDAGGLRKMRFADTRRGKGKRGGLRIIYYLWLGGRQFWMFTLYDKDEMDDMTAKERHAFADALKDELEKRK
ncbi:MAG: type II toxin-antitoxin system RelE/ParE family toxin [Betaproteobacteria bacterium]|nr:type II toxin-antitoxin system RelE/ParE family toxin [Betaproteobacteria bacterium]MCL2885360.1 type II toxin-antitoxin system RelE/ParE family toxin [Betaproteobacteria bacterium]